MSLFVVEEGQGTPVLVLHGFTGSSASMSGVAGALRDRHRVVRVDLVGHGRSDAPQHVAAYRIERCVAQLASVLDALTIPRAHVLGYSMGGRVALALAALLPARVASVLAIGARAGFEDPAERTARVRDDEALAARIERDGVPAFVDHWMALPLFATQQRLGAAALAEARAERLANRAHALAASLRAMGAGAQPPLHTALSQRSVPMLLVAGAEDARFAAVARDLAARLPDARVALVPNAGHAAHLENPDAFARIARSFLAAADPSVMAARFTQPETHA
ncbi:MAG: 2-succinyl-6-hydroxy-2,4-cyclohexadiene-1-carboxylate synthase [Proteobacteria bacterium]|nr:2-succinyl-6-hydroxy-2,4-cyclohexadiene-1-carboxylate synthase [Pseudomonadota bacterium]